MRYGLNQYFNTINVFSIEKIEVLRGSGSVQNGSDAIGGTNQAFSHNLVTTENPSWRSTPFARIATQGMEQRLNGTFNYSNNRTACRAGATWMNFGDLGTLGIVDFRYETPNFNLKPDHSFQYQIGYKYQNHKLRGTPFEDASRRI